MRVTGACPHITRMSETAPLRQNRPLVGVLWMLVTGVSFVIVNAIVKHVGGRIPPAESAWLRYTAGLVFLVPMMKPLLAAKIGRRELALLSLRGFIHTLGVILWFYAMTQIPMAEVTAINYLNPVGVTIGAALFLGERLAARRIIAIFVALIGAFIILRPGVRELSSGHYAMLATAGFFAASYLMVGRLVERVPPVAVVAMLSITVSIFLTPFALADWVTPTWGEMAWLFSVAAFATAGHYTMTLAFAAAPMTVTQPVTFLQLIWSVLIGALLFHEPADVWVIVGGGLILGSVSFITWREARLRRRVTPSVDQTRPDA